VPSARKRNGDAAAQTARTASSNAPVSVAGAMAVTQVAGGVIPTGWFRESGWRGKTGAFLSSSSANCSRVLGIRCL